MWPILFEKGGVVVPTYLVINSIAFLIAVLWSFKRAKKLKLNVNSTLDLCLVLMTAGFIGARLLHVLYERPQFYWESPLFIFKFWYGGFVFYGGFFLALVTGFFYCKWKELNFFSYADLFAPVIAAAYAVGRLGCLAAGCCFGRPTTLPWGISFPYGVEAPPGIPLHPTQIYFSLWEAVVCFVVLMAEKRSHKRKPGQLFGLWLILHALGRGIIEQFRGDFRGEVFFNLSLSSWLSCLALGLGFYLILRRGRHASTAL